MDDVQNLATPAELHLLHYLEEHGGCVLIKEFKEDNREYAALVKPMIESQLMTYAYSQRSLNSYAIGIRGQEVLLLEKQRREQSAEEERQHTLEQQVQDKRYRKDARRSWLQLLVTLFAGWLLGLLTPIDVWHWLSSLF